MTVFVQGNVTDSSDFQALGNDSVPANDTITVNGCGQTCVHLSDCTNGCDCALSSTTYEPSSNTMSYSYNCAAGSGGGGRRRNEHDPCPCNSTYVSYGCCDSVDGMVWEAKDLKLGKLKMS